MCFDSSGVEIDVEETIEECFINDARYGEYEDVKALLQIPEGRALINAQLAEHGHTALMMACSNNHLNIVELLLTIDLMDINLKNTAGNTALHWACLMGRKRAVEMLLNVDGTFGQYRADANLFNLDGKKPFDMAFNKGYSGVCEIVAKVTNFEYNSPEPPEEAEKHRAGGA